MNTINHLENSEVYKTSVRFVCTLFVSKEILDQTKYCNVSIGTYNKDIFVFVNF